MNRSATEKTPPHRRAALSFPGLAARCVGGPKDAPLGARNGPHRDQRTATNAPSSVPRVSQSIAPPPPPEFFGAPVDSVTSMFEPPMRLVPAAGLWLIN